MILKNRFTISIVLLAAILTSNNAITMDRINNAINKLIPKKEVVNQITQKVVDDSKEISVANILNNTKNKDFFIQAVSDNFLKYAKIKSYKKLIDFLSIFPSEEDIEAKNSISSSFEEWLNENFIIETLLYKYPDVAPQLRHLAIENFRDVDPLILNILLILDIDASSFLANSAIKSTQRYEVSLASNFHYSICYMDCFLKPAIALRCINESLIPFFEILINKINTVLRNNSLNSKYDLIRSIKSLLNQEDMKEFLKNNPTLEQILDQSKEEIYKYINNNFNDKYDFQQFVKQLNDKISNINEAFNNFKILVYFCLQNYQNFENQLKEFALKYPKEVPKNNLEIIHQDLMNEEEKAKLVKSVTQYLDLQSLNIQPSIEAILKNVHKMGNYPAFILNSHFNQNIKPNELKTQTQQHLFSNIGSVVKMLTETSTMIFSKEKVSKEKFQNERVQELIINMHNQETEEIENGNYVFYHGRNKNIRFSAEIYKQLWKVKNNLRLTSVQQKEFDQKIEKFVFMRFGSVSNDYLFMNHSIFGNSHEETGATTLTGYWLRNHSVRESVSLSTENLFMRPEFGFKKYFLKYESDLEKLQELHNKATEHGEIIALSIDPSKIHLVIPCAPGGAPIKVNVNGQLTSNAKIILDALKQDPSNVKLANGKSIDYIEWKLPIANSYALNTFKGPKFYSFYFMDEQSKKAYEDLRDQIFAKIKRDYELDLIRRAKQMSDAMSIASCL